MKSFTFEAADRDGRVSVGRLVAHDEQQALARLSSDGLFPVRIRPARSLHRFERVPSRHELAAALRSLEGLVRAGLPVDQALATTAGLLRGVLADQLEEARQLVRTGLPLWTAMEQAVRGLPPAVIGILRAGEQGGQLARSLEQAAVLVERSADLSSRLKQALAYPALLTVTGTISIGLIVSVVVPRFASLLQDSERAVPASTRLLLAASGFVRAYGFLALAVILVAALVAARWSGTASGRLARDRILLRLPWVGPISAQLATNRVAEALGPMLASGVPLMAAMRAATIAAGNRELERRLACARERTSIGGRLASSLEAERALWPQAIRLIAIGETNGRLAEMTTRAADLARAEAENRLKAIVTLLEPALILVFALAIGFVAAALLQAVYSLRPGAGV